MEGVNGGGASCVAEEGRAIEVRVKVRVMVVGDMRWLLNEMEV